MRTLFITRKYPPIIGGMENLSYGLTADFPEPRTIVSLGRKQTHLLWFLPYAIVRAALSAPFYDVIHLGDPLLCVVGLVPRLVFKRKVAMTVHGLDLTYPHWLYQTYLKLFLRADVFIAISASTRRIAMARGLAPLEVITIGVPARYLELSRPSSSDAELEERRQGRTVLITLGRLVKRKGVNWFVRNVLPKLPNVLYVGVGVGVDHDEIVQSAAETGTTDRVWLAGNVSDERLLNLLGKSDVFVMPNIEVPGDVEGFGIVAIEASASGLPVLASRLEGIPDAIADGKNGELVASGDAAAWLAAVQALTTDSNERERRGERGRAYTAQTYAWPRVIAQYAALFADLLREA